MSLKYTSSQVRAGRLLKRGCIAFSTRRAAHKFKNKLHSILLLHLQTARSERSAQLLYYIKTTNNRVAGD